MRKYIISGIITATIIAVAGVVFYACTKDSDALDGGRKVAVDLMALELYTPEEEVINDELLSFAEYMNEVNSLMPDMEIKDAIWFMEAFFNLAICAQQENGARGYNLKETYEFAIPYVEKVDDIFLDGSTLQNEYRALLTAIKAGVCPTYVINYGDVYAVSITNNTITLGLDIFYGCPFDPNCNCNCTGRICLCAGAVPMEPPFCHKIIDETFNPVEYYPYYTYANKHSSEDPFLILNILNKPTKDISMWHTLNQTLYVPDQTFPASIITQGLFEKTITLFTNVEDWRSVRTAVHSHGGLVVDINVYAPQYRDDIWNWWNNNKNNYPAGFEPLIAKCDIVAVPTSATANDVKHIYGLQSIARFCCGPPHVDFY